MVVVHAHGVVKPEARERALEIFRSMAAASRAEDACRGYRFYEDGDEPNSFVFIEEWDDLDGLYAHFRTPHLAEFAAGLGEVVAEPPVGTVLEVASTRTLAEAMAAGGGG